MADKRETFEEFLKRIGAEETTPIEDLPPERQAKLDDLKQLIKLKRIYGFGILGLMAAQLIVVNAGFLLYAGVGNSWNPPTGAIQIWLVATFVQIVSVVVVITNSLFPGGKAD